MTFQCIKPISVSAFRGTTLPCGVQSGCLLARMPYAIILAPEGTTVEILAVVAKSEAESWLAQFADPE